MKQIKLNPCVVVLIALVLTSAISLRASDLHVPADYATIQAAVDAAASGDTIHIAPGVYVEQIFIKDKNLNLIGKPGTILRAFPGMLPALPPWDEQRCILRIDEYSYVTIRDLSFEGDQLADENAPQLIGVNFDLSGGSVENCRFTGFREKTPGTADGQAVKFWNARSSALRYAAKVSNTTIVDSYSGIEILGAEGLTTYDVSVGDNTIIGVGPSSPADDMVGIRIGQGAVGDVVRNTISGFSYNGDGATRPPLAFGILAIDGFPDNVVSLEPLRLAENVLQNNQVHLGLVMGDNSTVDNNIFEGSAAGVRPAGLWLTGRNVQVSDNAFRDMAEGIRIGGADPDFGTILGVASNVTLINNRFCNVTANTTLQPLATATEQGTLLCPFPDPVLDIVSSFLLSWPEIERGFIVEAAPMPEGPWSPVEAKYFHQNGKHAVAVPMDSEHQYFRLVKP